MIENQYTRWIPHKDVIPMYDLFDFGFDKDSTDFFITLLPDYYKIDNGKVPYIKISWKNIVSKMISNESYRSDIWISEYDEVWCFYKSVSSDFFNFCCNEEKSAHLKKEDAIHYSFVCSNWIIDVISTYKPRIEFIYRQD
jgi:hypothetical protein